MSKKILSILLAISLVLNLLFFVFAYVQKAAADDARMQASANETEAMRQKAEAEQQARLAMECRAAQQTAAK